MKSLYPLIIMVLLAALAGCAPKPTAAVVQPTAPVKADPTAVDPAANSPWKVVYKAKVEQPVRMAVFMDDTFGLTGGADNAGRAHITTDGGETWALSEGSSGCLFSLDIIDQDVIWECNYSDVRPSLDGGKSWLDQARGRGQPGCMVSGADRTTAWHLTPAVFEITRDGGATRTPVKFPEGLSNLSVAAISLRTADEGYLLDTSGNLYITGDGGQTWAKRSYLGLDKYTGLRMQPYQGLPYAAIRFTDDRHGLAVMSLIGDANAKVLVLRTTDGGQTWTEETVLASFGQPYISHDGMYLTVTSYISMNEVTLLHYEGEQ